MKNREMATVGEIRFQAYTADDYEAVCRFLIELNRENRDHVNWNWARFEWMAEHPEFDQSLLSSIGLWWDGERVVGAAIYDMYFGEGFCGVLPGYEELYPRVLDYACRELRDDGGFGLAVCDDDRKEIELVKSCGLLPAEQEETVMTRELDGPLSGKLPEGFRFVEMDPVREADEFQWLLWQGFDHGEDRAEFEREETIVPRKRRHFNRDLSVAVEDPAGRKAAYCCLWYHKDTDYAYVEPVCTIPAYRGRGIGRALVSEVLDRARRLGAKRAYVISDLGFYESLGFEKEKHFSFYWKHPAS